MPQASQTQRPPSRRIAPTPAPRGRVGHATERHADAPDHRQRRDPGGPRRPREPRGLPIGAALELARWAFGQARAQVADFPEETDAIDRVAAAVEAVITGRCPDALAQVEESDLLTVASILLTSTAADLPDGESLAAAVGAGLDLMTHGAGAEFTPTAIPAPAWAVGIRPGSHRAPLLVRHLRLVP